MAKKKKKKLFKKLEDGMKFTNQKLAGFRNNKHRGKHKLVKKTGTG